MKITKIKCLCCSGNKSYLVLQEKLYNLYRCCNCNVVYLYPRNTEDKFKINNTRYDFIDVEKAYFLKRNILENRAKNTIYQVMKYSNCGTILDVGCSYGFYLNIFKQYGFKVEGIEITKKAINYVENNLGIKVYSGNFKNFNFNKKKYDIITLFDVIEHQTNPNYIIGKIYSLLTEKGIVVIQTPNYDSIIAKITRTKWFWLLLPQHQYLFNISSLKYLLEKNGFQILFIKTWDDFDEFIKNILKILYLKDKGKTKFLYFILYYFLYIIYPFMKIWQLILLGGEIELYAQKVE